jgi:hypothetical protein
MESDRQEYKGHRIEVRVPEAEQRRSRHEEQGEQLDLLIDDERIRYGKMPDGTYFLHEHAYDWRDDLVDLARALIDYRDRTDEVRRQADTRGE